MPVTTQRVMTYLLVEDNDDHAEIVERCFRYNNLASKVRRVKTGADCLAYLAGEKQFGDRQEYPCPDVVLLDIRIPGVVDGLQTLKAIRANPQYTSLWITMLTSSDRDLDVSRAYRLGANGYIVKSDDTEEMIEQLLRLHQSFDPSVELPQRKRRPELGSLQEADGGFSPAAGAQSFLESSRDAALALLVSAYERDPDETLSLLRSVEQVNATRFTSLAHRFCVDHRHAFAGGHDVDWIFIREVVMDKLPRYMGLRELARVVAGIAAVLDGNVAAERDESSWQLWQEFRRACLNQGTGPPAEPAEALDAPPQVSQLWKAIAIGALIVLLGLLVGRIARGLL